MNISPSSSLRRSRSLFFWPIVLVLVMSSCTATGTNGGPAMEVDLPPEGTVVDGSTIDITGRVEGAGVDTRITATVGGTNIDCIVDASRFLCSDVPLSMGANQIVVVAEGANGESARRTIEVTASGVMFSRIVDDMVVAYETLDVRGSMFIDGTVASVDVSVNGGEPIPCAFSEETFTCSDVPLESGPNTVRASVRDLDGDMIQEAVALHHPVLATSETDFKISLVFFDAPFTSEERQVFRDAAQRWSDVIENDLANAGETFFAEGEACGMEEPAFFGPIDDVIVFVTGFEQAPGGTLGLAGPCRTRTSGEDIGTNMVGYMEFDAFDLEELGDTGQLFPTILHEMGHVLGIGTNWDANDFFDLLDYRTVDGEPCQFTSGFLEGPIYVGSNAMAAYGSLRGTVATPVPVEDEWGVGTQCGHWDEEVFANELMSGFLDTNTNNPMSLLTVRSLEDIGFEVDRAQAEPYNLPMIRAQGAPEGLPIGEREVLLMPIGGIDPATGDLVPFPSRPEHR